MPNPQEFPAQLKCHKCHNSARSLVRGECDACQQAPRVTAGICGGCGDATTHYRKSGMFTWGWMCTPCWDGVVPEWKKDDRATVEGWEDGKSYAGTNIQIVTAAHTGGHVDWEYEFAAVNEAIRARDVRTVANGPRLACIMCGVKTTSLVNGVCPWCPRKVKGPDGIYRCPECGCHEGEIHTGPCLERRLKAREIRGTTQEEERRAFLRDTCLECGAPQESHTSGACLERRLEEKAKQGIYAALADLRAHGADMRVRISRLRWIPKYIPKAEPVVVSVPRRRMTFRDFVRQIVSAVLAAI